MYAALYILGSLGLNIILLFFLKRVHIVSSFFIIFVFLSIMSVATGVLVIPQDKSIVIFVRYVWFLSSFLVCHALIKYDMEESFETMRVFFIYFSYLVVFDMAISYLIVGNIHVQNEGLVTTIVPSVISKYLSYAALPFLVISGKRYWMLALVIFATTLVGTRAGMLAGVFSLFSILLMFFEQRHKVNVLLVKIGFIVLGSVMLFGSFIIANDMRTKPLDNTSSMVARVAIWASYLSLLREYPLGLGPQGGYYLLKYDGFHTDIDMVDDFLGGMISEKDLRDRFNILASKSNEKGISEESLHIDFIVAYGAAAIAFWCYLIIILLVDLKRAIFTPIDYRLSVVYISFVAVLIYGLFNSFHNGVFYIALLYCAYHSFRRYPNKEINAIGGYSVRT